MHKAIYFCLHDMPLGGDSLGRPPLECRPYGKRETSRQLFSRSLTAAGLAPRGGGGLIFLRACVCSLHSSNSHMCQFIFMYLSTCSFPTAAARVRSQVKSCGICGGQPSTSVFPANSDFTKCSLLIYHQ
jgi:hypothetical protein